MRCHEGRDEGSTYSGSGLPRAVQLMVSVCFIFPTSSPKSGSKLTAVTGTGVGRNT